MSEVYRQPEFRRLDEMHAQLADALRDEVEPDRAAAIVTRLALAAAQAVAGTCRQQHSDGHYAELRPVLDADGLRFCCIGDPPHCSGLVDQ
jgi:hypothetical protein